MIEPAAVGANTNRRKLLQAFVLLGAVAGTIYYAAIWRWWWLIPPTRRDGFELIGLVLGTAYAILLVVPCWYLGLKKLALGFAAFLSAAALGIAADGLFPWIPW